MNQNKTFLWLVFSVLIHTSIWAQSGYREVFDVTYLTIDGQDLKLDLFIPQEINAPTPTIVGLHGGAWIKGNRKNFHRVCRGLAARGYIAVSVSYRLAEVAPFPAQIQDIQAAIRWLKVHASDYQIDPDRIGVAGFSAGGHLAALVATAGNDAEGWEAIGELGSDATVKIAFPMAAQSDLETDRIRQVSQSEEQYFYRIFLSGSLDENPETYKLASPLTHLDGEDPPVFFVCGEKDNPSTKGDNFRSKMDELGLKSDLLIVPNAPHVFLTDEAWRSQTLDYMIKYIKLYL